MLPSDITSFYLIYTRLQITLVGSIKITFMRICEKYFKNWQVTKKSKHLQWMEQLIKKQNKKNKNKKKREKKKSWISWISQKRIICRSCGLWSSEYSAEISCRYMITPFKYLNISIVMWQFNYYQNTQKIQRQDVYRWIIWKIHDFNKGKWVLRL